MTQPVTTRVPTLPKQCTPEWLMATVLNTLNIPTEGIELTIGPLKDISGGYMSHMTKASLEWSGQKKDTLPKSLMVKAITLEKITAQITNQGLGTEDVQNMLEAFGKGAQNIHDNECYMYTKFLAHPSLTVKTPRCFAAVSGSGFDSEAFIVMEDLSTTSGTIPLHHSFTMGQLRAVIDAIADVHAHSIKNSEWISGVKPIEVADFEDMSNSMSTFLDSCRLKNPKEFEGITTEQIDSITKIEQWLEVTKDGAYDWPVLAHGDLWTNNIMFHRTENGDFTDELAAVIDWQVVHRGQPGEDLSRIIATHLESEDRKAHEKDLVKYYHSQIEKRFEGTAPFPLSYLQQWYEKSMTMQASILLTLQTLVTINFTDEQSTKTAKRCADLLRDVISGYYKKISR